MLQQHTHPKVLQERLGHSDISLTLNTYSHVLPDIQEEAAENISQSWLHIESNFKVKDSIFPINEASQLSNKN